MKRGKEVKVKTKENYRIVYGNVDNEDNQAIYVKISAWGQIMLDGTIDYGKIIKDIRKSIKQEIHNSENSYYNGDIIIVDFDMRESGITYGRSSFMSCEITLYPKKPLPINDEYLTEKTMEVINVVIDDVLDKTPYFDFYLGKDAEANK